MGINNISLSPELLAALYPDSLVMGKTEKEAEGKEDYPFLGNHLRRISFIVSYPESVFLPDEDLEFLGKMLSACHCSIADISILNTARTPVDIGRLVRQLNPEKLFLCGISPTVLNIRAVPEDPFTITGWQGISVLLIPSFNSMNRKTEESLALKKKLWASLQKLFSL
jgi:hypothetical protein